VSKAVVRFETVKMELSMMYLRLLTARQTQRCGGCL
jgi:hypothetical protein